MESRSEYLLKLCHKSSVFTPESVARLRDSGAVDISDFISLVFLTAENLQFPEMYKLLSSIESSSLNGVDLYEILQRIPNWERKLLEALVRINNLLAITTMKIRLLDLKHNIGKPTYCLSPSRVILYRIFEHFTIKDTGELVNKLSTMGAPMPDRQFSNLELYFMYWHVNGFLNVDTQEGFHRIAESLKEIGKPQLAGTLGWHPNFMYDKALFVDDYQIEVYPIKDVQKVGLCLIINQVKYGGKETDRVSSVSDAANLEELMVSFNFSVVSLQNISASEFCNKIQTGVFDHFLESHSIFLLVVMAHGDCGRIMCPDLKIVDGSTCNDQLPSDQANLKTTSEDVPLGTVYTRDIQNCLFECNALKGKPKIVIFNACRGRDVFTNLDYFKGELVADAIQPDAHSHVDIITCYSTLPDFISYRDRKKGSLFINVFRDVLTNCPEIEICELFTLMNARLMQPTPELSDEFLPGRRAKKIGVANPFNFTSSLRKKLFFKVPESNG